MMPSVGVIVPLYKHSTFVKDSIVSALEQEEISVEIFCVIDGCPFPESYENIYQCARLYPNKVRFVYQENGGLSAARNAGLRYFSSKNVEAVYFLDSDNTIDCNAISNALADMRAGNADWVYPDFRVVGPSHSYYNTAGEFNPHILKFRNFCEAGSLISRRVLDSGIEFDETFREGYEDWEFWIHLLFAGFRGSHSSRLTLRYRQRHESMVTDSKRKHEKIFSEIISKHQEHYTSFEIAKSENVHAPRYLFIDPLSGDGYMGSSYRSSVRYSLKQIRELILSRIGNEESSWLPEYFIFAPIGVIESLDQEGLLGRVLSVIGEHGDRSPIAKFCKDVRGSEQHCGIERLKAGSHAALSFIAIHKRIFLEVVADESSDWILSQIQGASNVAASYRYCCMGESAIEYRLGTAIALFFEGVKSLSSPSGIRNSLNGKSGAYNVYTTSSEIYTAESQGFGKSYLPYYCLRAFECGFSRNIGFVLPFAGFGGVEKVMLEAAKHYKALGWGVHLFVDSSDFVSSHYLESGVFNSVNARNCSQECVLPSSYLGTPVPALKGEVLDYWESALGWLDVAYFSNSLYALQVVSRIRRRGVKAVMHTHNHDITFSGRFAGFPFVTAGYEHQLDLIVTCSERNLQQMLALGVPRSKVVLVENRASVSVASERKPPSRAEVKLLFLGRFDRQKGIDRLGPVVAALETLGVKFQLRIAGGSVLDSSGLPPILKKYSIGLLQGEELEAALDWADFMLIPSYWEGLPLVLLDGLAKGVVPVCSDVGDMGDFVRRHKVGEVVNWNDCEGCVEGIVALLGDRERIARYQRNSLDFSLLHNWDEVLTPLCEYIDRLLPPKLVEGLAVSDMAAKAA